MEERVHCDEPVLGERRDGEDRIHVELYSRQADGGWSLHEWSDRNAGIELVSLGCRLHVAEIYAKVNLDLQPST